MSAVWNYFKRSEKNKYVAFCNLCSKQIGCKGSSTTPLLNHLKIHEINLKSPLPTPPINIATTTSEQNKETDEGSTSKKFKNSNQPSIRQFIKTESLDEILSRCVAEDGYSMSSLLKSRAIKGYIQSKGLIMPQSKSTITSSILKFYNIKKEETIKVLYDLKKRNIKFGITVDEWTDLCMKRYINVSLHACTNDHLKKFEVFVLGLVYIRSTCNAEQTKIYVENKLDEFEIDIQRDVISSTHDGAAVMVKYGRILGITSQLCINHGLHLAITDVLYRKKSIISFDESDDAKDSDEEDVQDLEDFYIIPEHVQEEAASNHIICEADKYYEVLKNVRKIIKMFKASSVKNNVLQGYVIEQEGKPLQLILDIKIRWNSLVSMLKRFIQLKEPLNKALHELGQQKITDNDLTILQDLYEVLSPLETAECC